MKNEKRRYEGLAQLCKKSVFFLFSSFFSFIFSFIFLRGKYYFGLL